MKILPVVLAATLVGHAVLLLIPRPAASDAPSAIGTTSTGATRQPAGASSDTAKPQRGSITLDGPVPVADIWTALQQDDLAGYVANLRAAGFPDEIVRTLVWRRINDQFAAEEAQLRPSPSDWKYWTNTSPFQLDQEQQKARAALARQKTALAEALLGPAPPNEIQLIQQAHRYGELSPEKIAAIELINRDYNELRRTVNEAAKGFNLPEDWEKLALLQREQDADLAAVLSPEEYRRFQLRNSATASRLRGEFNNISLTEAQFQQLYDLRAPLDQRFNTPGIPLTATEQTARRDAEAALQDSYRAILGDERYTEYQRSRDGAYQQLTRLANRLDLPAANAIAVYDLKTTVESRARELHADRSLSTEQRQAALAALRDSTERTVTAALGERGAAIYRDQGGHWFKNLVPERGGN